MNIKTHKIQGKISLSTPLVAGSIKTTKIYPDLEDLEITPSEVEQNFKSKMYGYNNVKVKPMEYPPLEDLEITPSGFEQNFKSQMYGYNNIKVKPVASDVIDVIPSFEKQQYMGLFNTVNVEAMKVPSEQWYEKGVEKWI